MKNSISKYLVGGVSVFIIILILSNLVLKAEVERIKKDNTLLNSAIELQNDIIKQNELDLEKYKNQKPKIVEKINTKYKNIVVRDRTCEEELQTIKNAISAFYNNN